MIYVIIALFVWLILYIVATIRKSDTDTETDVETLSASIELNLDPDVKLNRYDDSVQTYIAGVKHHNTPADCRQFVGVVVPHRSNQYDPNAIAIIDLADNSLVGYVPKSETREVRAVAGDTAFCCGVVFESQEDGAMFGRVCIIKQGNRADTVDIMTDFLAYSVEHQPVALSRRLFPGYDPSWDVDKIKARVDALLPNNPDD